MLIDIFTNGGLPEGYRDAFETLPDAVHYLVLENEGHGFSKNENYLAAFKLTDRFLDRYIHGDASVQLTDNL